MEFKRPTIKAYGWLILVAAVVGLLALAQLYMVAPVSAREPAANKSSATETNGADDPSSELTEPGQVIVDGRTVVTIYQPVGSFTPQQRADRIAERIIALARDGRIPPDALQLEDRDLWTEIKVEDRVIMVVTEIDARAAKKKRAQLAEQDLQSIRQTIITYRNEHTWNSLLRGIAYTILSTTLFVCFAWAVRKLRFRFRARAEKWIQSRTHVQKKSAWHVTVTYFSTVLLGIGAILRWVLLVALFETYLTITLGFFSSTRAVSHAVTEWVLEALGIIGRTALDYLPNLLLIALILLIASQVLRLVSMVFKEIAAGTLTVGGFYPDWAEPTAKLVRSLIIILVLIIIFPYLPGAKSPAFQGISIFLGVLLSLGSSSAVANAVSGVILTYMRSFLVGEWVQIGQTTGEVVEKNLLVTRILTPKHEIITIPNATVMNGAVMNYTRESKNTGVIFHTTVTIGYDAPWRTVHQLLIKAAADTKHVLHTPEPFVLQTALNDFYVAYELNAYTAEPRQMQFIYSELHENIQDQFNEAGVEICSPHFSALRDGNTIAIPEAYIPRDYQSPSFRVDDNRKEHERTQAAGKD